MDKYQVCNVEFVFIFYKYLIRLGYFVALSRKQFKGCGLIENEARIVPLYVDLDGTLLRIDTLHEAFLASIKKNPLVILFAFFWLLKGKAYFKQKIAGFVRFDVSALPAHQEFLAFLNAEKQLGRRLVLATAADGAIAGNIASRFGIFDAILASDGITNLSSARKRDAILRDSGGVYDYAGNSSADLAIWANARRAIIVGAPRTIVRKVHLLTDVQAEFPSPPLSLRMIAKALRLHQWLKNLLVFIPLLAAHQIFNPALVLNCVLAFFAYGFCASSVYVLNDLLDLESDRNHPRKSKRAFAAGVMPSAWGGFLIPFLLLLAGALAAFLPIEFTAVLAIYYVVTISYSFLLKKISTLDIFVLAGLYTLRIVAGGAATGIHLSFWILAFSMFLFLGLAAIKRVSELVDAKEDAGRKVGGRGYDHLDIESLSSIGVSSGFAAVLVLALYIKSPEVEILYRHPQVILLLCPLLLYWLSRCWVGARRGKIDDDPLVFAVRDNVSRLVIAAAAILIFLAT